MPAFAREPDDPVKQLLRLGTRLGYLTYEMLNEMLPDEFIRADKLGGLFAAIDRGDIRLIDEADVPDYL